MFKVKMERLDVTGSRVVGTVEFNAMTVQEGIDKATAEAPKRSVCDVEVYNKYDELVQFMKLLPE